MAIWRGKGPPTAPLVIECVVIVTGMPRRFFFLTLQFLSPSRVPGQIQVQIPDYRTMENNDLLTVDWTGLRDTASIVSWSLQWADRAVMWQQKRAKVCIKYFLYLPSMFHFMLTSEKKEAQHRTAF